MALADVDIQTYVTVIIFVFVVIAALIWRITKANKHRHIVERGVTIATGILEAKRIVSSSACCSHCGYANPSTDDYCGRCGEPLRIGDRTRVY